MCGSYGTFILKNGESHQMHSRILDFGLATFNEGDVVKGRPHSLIEQLDATDGADEYQAIKPVTLPNGSHKIDSENLYVVIVEGRWVHTTGVPVDVVARQ